MATINLRDFYPWYIQDELVEVSDEIAAELLADKQYHKTHERRMRYNKTYFLDADTETEAAAIAHTTDNPEALVLRMEQHCRLCRALNSLPEIQGRRIEAHYIFGKSQSKIAEAEGVTKGAVSISLTRGLEAMKKYLKKSDVLLNFRPFCPL